MMNKYKVSENRLSIMEIERSPFTTARASGPSFSFKVVPYIVHGAPIRNPRKGTASAPYQE